MKCYYNDRYTNDIEAKAKSTQLPGMTWEDVAQELDIALWLGLPKFSGRNGATERTFAQTIMNNRVRDLKKAAWRQKRLIDARHLDFADLEATETGKMALKRLGLSD
jgi:DNA-directed RNA polymerase specialized sigma24 family protein